MTTRFGKALCACILSVLALGSLADEGTMETLTATPVAYLPLDEGAGFSASFGAGVGNIEGGALWTPGQQGTALELDGSGYVAIADPVDGSLDLELGLTIALWVRPDSLTGHRVLVSKDDAYELEFGNLAPSRLNLRLNNFIEGTATTPLQAGVWQHLAVTYDGFKVRYYRNGVLDGDHPHGNPIQANSRNVGIGARPSPLSSGGPVYQFKGGVDEVRIYDEALSTADIMTLFASSLSDMTPPQRSYRSPGQPLAVPQSVAIGLVTDEAATCRYVEETEGVTYDNMVSDFTTLDGLVHRDQVSPEYLINRYYVRCRDAVGNVNGSDYLVAVVVGDVDLEASLEAYWTFDDGAGCNATDGTQLHDGSLGPDCAGGNVPQWVPGILGTGLSFDGGDVVQASNAGALRQPAGFTLSAWIRHDGTPKFRSIVDIRDSGTDGYNLYLTDQSRLFMRVGNTTLDSPQAVPGGSWHHVAGVYDGTSMILYVDGTAVATRTAVQSIDVSADLRLGQHFSQPTYGYSGSMDEVVLYSRGLEEAEVLQLFLETQP